MRFVLWIFAIESLATVYGMVIVKPIVNGIDSVLNWATKSDTKNPLYVKSPNWMPLKAPEVQHDQAIELELVQGKLPRDLNGIALRVGPNAAEYFDESILNGIIDGDGMLHSVRFDGSKALYSAGWLHTPRHNFEHQLGRPYFHTIGQLKGFSGIARLILGIFKRSIANISSVQEGQANTALFQFDGRFFALQENSIPFEFNLNSDSTFESVGYEDFGGVLDFPFGAHPRVDPDSGKMYFCGYDPARSAPLRWGCIAPSTDTAKAKVETYMPVKLQSSGCSFAHDFLMTDHYVILLDSSARFDFSKIISGDVIQYEEDVPLRLGVCPKSAKSADEVMWYELDRAAVILHYVNAWEDGNTIRIWAPVWDKFVSDVIAMTDNPADIMRMTEFVIDLSDTDRRLKSRVVEEGTAVDFPVVNRNFAGRKTTHAYAGISRNSVIDFDGISQWKTNAPENTKEPPVHNILHGTGVTGGEPIVAPKVNIGKKRSESVYVINFIHDANENASFLVIYDGENFRTDNMVAKYKMPHRVPHGLHAMWVDADALMSPSS